MDPNRRPIGYWLKHLNELIEARAEEALAGLRLTRRHWQVLNLLHSGPATRANVDEELAPFRDEDGRMVNTVLDSEHGLVSRRWVQDHEGMLMLTDQGRAGHTEAATRIGQTRDLLMRDLTPQQYQETIEVLSTMSANLETRT